MSCLPHQRAQRSKCSGSIPYGQLNSIAIAKHGDMILFAELNLVSKLVGLMRVN